MVLTRSNLEQFEAEQLGNDSLGSYKGRMAVLVRTRNKAGGKG